VKKEGGYSLIELLLTVCFVTLGTQVIQTSFLQAADVFGRYSNTIRSMVWANEETAKAREAFLRKDVISSDAGALMFGGKEVSWARRIESMAGPGLHSIRLVLSWTESGRPVTLDKESYVYQKED
jgi:hypothetical protein